MCIVIESACRETIRTILRLFIYLSNTSNIADIYILILLETDFIVDLMRYDFC